MNIYLLYLAEPKYGGWATFTAHLHRGIRNAGFNPVLIKHGNTSEKKTRNYGRKIRYQNLCANDIINLAKYNHCLITAVDKNHHELTAQLLALGTPLIIHDPTELKAGLIEHLNENTIVDRAANLKHLPNAPYIPHPYDPKHPTATEPKQHAVSISRVDFDKHTEIICEANTQLTNPISIYGAMNRLYANFKLNTPYPNWQDNYKGTFDPDDLWAGARIAANHIHTVDMSIIKGDGGGTQYTFLEAIDAQSNLIIHTEWNPTGLLTDCVTTVSNATELVTALQQPPTNNTEARQELLQHHNATSIAKQYAELLKWELQ